MIASVCYKELSAVSDEQLIVLYAQLAYLAAVTLISCCDVSFSRKECDCSKFALPVCIIHSQQTVFKHLITSISTSDATKYVVPQVVEEAEDGSTTATTGNKEVSTRNEEDKRGQKILTTRKKAKGNQKKTQAKL